MESKKCIIYGAGSVGRLALQIIEDLNKISKDFEVLGFVDDNEKLHGTYLNGYKVFGGFSYLKISGIKNIIISFSQNSLRHSVFNNISKHIQDIKFPTIIHPSVWLGQNVKIGKGVIIYPSVCIDPDVSIDDFSILNKLTSLGHDTSIGKYVTLSPGVKIGGFNVIKDKVYLGINSSSLQYMKLGENSVIGAGAVVTKNIPANCTAVGIPAKPIKFHEELDRDVN